MFWSTSWRWWWIPQTAATCHRWWSFQVRNRWGFAGIIPQTFIYYTVVLVYFVDLKENWHIFCLLSRREKNKLLQLSSIFLYMFFCRYVGGSSLNNLIELKTININPTDTTVPLLNDCTEVGWLKWTYAIHILFGDIKCHFCMVKYVNTIELTQLQWL